MEVEAYAPGRVNLIGDHTDYTGGLALPMAIDLGTRVTGRRGGTVVRLRSADLPGEAVVDLGGPVEPSDQPGGHPTWTRYVDAVVREVAPPTGLEGDITTTLPVGAGLSSSAALEVAVALAVGATGSSLEIARLCQRAEQRASGVPCGIMDQLASVSGVAGHALLMDFATLDVVPVPVPDDVQVLVVHSGEPRALAGSSYADRRASCERAAAEIGPLRDADLAAVDRLTDHLLRRRARHVVTENQRVRSFAESLAAGDLARAGRLMNESHASLRDDFEVSTPTLDALVAGLTELPGVYGARLTGAGFGGCAVALCDRSADHVAGPDGVGGLAEGPAWVVQPADGARVTTRS